MVCASSIDGEEGIRQERQRLLVRRAGIFIVISQPFADHHTGNANGNRQAIRATPTAVPGAERPGPCLHTFITGR